ncbi:OmpA family protein [Devosia sp. CC-YST696]|nr:OmpA family protein [Devosia faecipullorum]
MLAALFCTNALPTLADATIPIADIEGAADTGLIKRYEGAFIVSYESHAYAELRIPLSPLQPGASGEYDAMNNRIYRPERAETLEGKVTRLVYVVPENRSPLEVLRNYQDEIAAANGQVEFECKRDECGGDANRAAYGGGNKMSLMQYFFYESDIKDAPYSNGACAVTSRINDQHFTAARIPQGDATAWVAVQTFQLDAGTYCKALNGRTIAVVHVLEPKAREQKMVLVKAEDMADAIDHDGSIALYGIYFDTAKANLTPDSAPTLKEIAALLGGRPELAVLIVGHTDSQGSYDYNLDLSARRADAVKAALVSSYGVDARRLTAAGAGMMAPVASNATDEGRARNRRVTIVPVN